jgi:hypothetical protein
MEVSGQFNAPAALPAWEKAASTHWKGGRVGPRAGLDAVEMRTISCPRREPNPAIQPVAHRSTDRANTSSYL